MRSPHHRSRRTCDDALVTTLHPYGVLVLTPLAPLAPELAREIERARIEVGLSVEEMLQDLRDQRERYMAEKHGVGGE